MPAGNAKDFAYFRYVDDVGGNWAMRADKDWGGLAASGLAAFNAADPAWPRSARYRARKVLLIDPVSGRKTSRPIGPTATIRVAGQTVDTVVFGAAGVVTLTSQGFVPERRPHTGAIISKAEPIAH
jgi:hypothetical protein